MRKEDIGWNRVGRRLAFLNLTFTPIPQFWWQLLDGLNLWMKVERQWRIDCTLSSGLGLYMGAWYGKWHIPTWIINHTTSPRELSEQNFRKLLFVCMYSLLTIIIERVGERDGGVYHVCSWIAWSVWWNFFTFNFTGLVQFDGVPCAWRREKNDR